MRSIFIVSALLVTAGCRTVGSDSGSLLSSVEARHDHSLKAAVNDIQTRRTVAGTQDAPSDLAKTLGISNDVFMAKLRKNHVILLFPKNTLVAEDDRRSDPSRPQTEIHVAPEANPLVMYDRPARFDFHTINPVHSLCPASERGACALIKFKPSDARTVVRQRGKVSSVELSLGADYKGYGVKVSHFLSKWESSEEKTVASKLDPLAGSVDSRFDAVPYDIPNLYTISRSMGAGNSVEEVNKLFIPKADDPYVIHYLTKRVKRGFTSYKSKGLCSSKALVINYKGSFGVGRQTAGWCKGDAWPSFIDNKHFTAVLIKKP